jgi:tetratricopeptide (TPR) repeat protein
MKRKAVLLGVVPGAGHLYLRRHVQGVVFFGLFAAALDGVLIGFLWQDPAVASRILHASATAAAIVWLLAMASVVNLAVLIDRDTIRRAREVKLREALAHYLRDEPAEAAEALEQVRALDIDANDAEVLFHLAVVRRRLGERRAARRLLKRCLAVDQEGTWRFEVEEELRAMVSEPRNGSASNGAGAPPPPRAS